jgi:peptide/nickel transport system substrate-binding protein
MNLLALGAALFCSSVGASSTGTLVEAHIEAPETVDPAWAFGAESEHLIGSVYDKLLDFEGSSVDRLEPRLSMKVPSQENGFISKDSLTYRFPIRQGVRFHDGTLLTPEDVRYSLLRFMFMDRLGGPSALLLEPVIGETSTLGRKPPEELLARAERAITVDGGSLVIRLKRPFSPLLALLAHVGYVQSKSWCAAHGSWDGTPRGLEGFARPRYEANPINGIENGTGPFTLERWDKAAQAIYLKRFDGYWRTPAALERVVWRVVPDFNTRKLMLQSGDADIAYLPPELEALAYGDDRDVVLGPFPRPVVTLIYFGAKLEAGGNPNIGSGKLDGQGIPPDFFTDRDVRLAFAYALDTASYAREALKGKAKLARGVVPSALFDYKDLPSVHFDLDQAREHLRLAWKGLAWERGFHFEIDYTAGNQQRENLARMIKRNLESLNPKISIDVRGVLPATLVSRQHANFLPLDLGSWAADYPDPHAVVSFLLGSKIQGRSYRDPAMDALIERAARSSGAARRGAYEELHQRWLSEMPILALLEPLGLRWQRRVVEGFVFNPMYPGAPVHSDYYRLSKTAP